MTSSELSNRILGTLGIDYTTVQTFDNPFQGIPRLSTSYSTKLESEFRGKKTNDLNVI